METDIGGAQWLSGTYRRRFATEDEVRRRVWKILIDAWFSRYLVHADAVLDLGCGWGHFVNQISVPHRYAIDLNPDAAQRLDPGVELVGRDAAQPWALPDASLDLVFTSNFLEHLPDRDAITAALGEAARCLRPGGRLVCLGPNVRYAPGAYWDFFDHAVPLTERSMAEAIEIHPFRVDEAVGRFLPWSMAGRSIPPTVAIRAYLRLPVLWRVVGRQFLVVATRR
jgi:SAM-dependent methyltransferase